MHLLRRRRLGCIKSRIQHQGDQYKTAEQQTTTNNVKVFLPRLSFLKCRFCHEPRRLVSSVLLFEQEQVPLVHQRRHLSSFKFFLSFARIMNAHHAGTNGQKVRRGRDSAPKLELSVVCACGKRVYLFLETGFF